MARARNIKPGFFANELLIEGDFATRLLFIGLWTLADRRGRLEDRPKKIKVQLFPGDDIDVDRALAWLAEKGFIVRYAVDEARYIQVVNFDKHQRPHSKEAASTIPDPESTNLGEDEHQPRTVRARPDSLIPDSLIPDTPPPPTPSPAPKQERAAAKLTQNGKHRDPGYVALLGEGWGKVTMDFGALNAEFGAPWLRGALCHGPPGLNHEQLLTGLELAYRRIEQALSTASAEFPIRNPRRFGETKVVEALQEVAGGPSG